MDFRRRRQSIRARRTRQKRAPGGVDALDALCYVRPIRLVNAQEDMVPNTIATGDALDFLAQIQPGRAGLVYLDPPWLSAGKDFRFADRDAVSVRNEYLDWTEQVLRASHRLLANAGALVLHPDPVLAGRCRVLLEDVFGISNFQGEVIVPRRGTSAGKMLAREHDTLLFFSKSDGFKFNRVYRVLPHPDRGRLRDERGAYRHIDATVALERPGFRFEWGGHSPPPGRSWRFGEGQMRVLASEGRLVEREGKSPLLKQYLHEAPGQALGTVWDDLAALAPPGERYGWPGQQSLEMLKRIIQMSTTPDGWVVDPFCGSGTTLLAAQQRGRRWLGCDLSSDAVRLTRERLHATDSASFQLLEVAPMPRTGVPAASTSPARARPDTFDVFISHAHEDKDTVVRPLAEALRRQGLEVWYDEFTLEMGDSLRESIDFGLSRSHFGVVVFSPAFLTKRWTQYELNGLVGREMAGRKVILPIWHDITPEQLMGYSPAFADRVARQTSATSIEKIAREIAEIVGRMR